MFARGVLGTYHTAMEILSNSFHKTLGKIHSIYKDGNGDLCSQIDWEMKIMAKCLPPGFKKFPAILSFQFPVSETGRRPTSVDGNMTATLKIPPSTLVKSRQQNVGGSFYRIWRHDPCKLFKVIQLSPIIHQHLFVVVSSEFSSWEWQQYLIRVFTYFSRCIRYNVWNIPFLHLC